MQPSINIDGLNFTLLYRAYDDDKNNIRKLIIYCCDNSDQQYISYKSNSDINWRFAYKNRIAGEYVKGYNYITTTQIHQDLQIFFYKNYNDLPELLDISKIATIYSSLKMIYNDEENTEFSDIIEDDTLTYKHDVFVPLKKCPNGDSTNRYCFMQKNILNAFDIDYEIKSKYNECMFEILQQIKNDNKTLFEKYNIHSFVQEEDRKTFYNLIVNAFSKYMEYFFELDGVPKFIYDININVPYEIGSLLTQKITVYIFKIILKLKDSDLRFILYYGIYDYIGYNSKLKSLESNSKSYKIILNLLPIDSKINKYGMNEKYIAIQTIYIYKMFEYHHFTYGQAAQVDYDNDLPGNYTFIGDLLNNLWPLQHMGKLELYEKIINLSFISKQINIKEDELLLLKYDKLKKDIKELLIK